MPNNAASLSGYQAQEYGATYLVYLQQGHTSFSVVRAHTPMSRGYRAYLEELPHPPSQIHPD